MRSKSASVRAQRRQKRAPTTECLQASVLEKKARTREREREREQERGLRRERQQQRALRLEVLNNTSLFQARTNREPFSPSLRVSSSPCLDGGEASSSRGCLHFELKRVSTPRATVYTRAEAGRREHKCERATREECNKRRGPSSEANLSVNPVHVPPTQYIYITLSI